jgi:hypothetical protein
MGYAQTQVFPDPGNAVVFGRQLLKQMDGFIQVGIVSLLSGVADK